MPLAQADFFSQSQHFTAMRGIVRPRQLLVLMDFTSVYLTPKIGHQAQHQVVQDCIVVLEYIEADGKRVRLNIDFLCDDPDSNKNDYHFVLQAWIALFLSLKIVDNFDEIDIWSDGGPHHFKTRYCQCMWHWLSQKRFAGKRISHHFFASYHGHSLADSHAASIKRVLRNEFQQSQLQRFNETTLAVLWGPANAQEMSVAMKRCKDTQIVVFRHIDRDPELKPDPQSLVQIKRQHRFDYEKGLCYAAEPSAGAERTLFSFYLREHSESNEQDK